jgi:Phosphotransferase enzyme family
VAVALSRSRPAGRPSVEALERAIEEALGEPGAVTVDRIEPNWYSSTFPSEVVRCAVESRPLALLCKYDLAWTDEVRGVLAGPRYEAEAYRLAVEPAGLPAPRSLGLRSDEHSGARWLMLELVHGDRFTKSTESGAMARGIAGAAAWIGSFHRFHERRGPERSPRLVRHDRESFAACVARAREQCEPLRSEYPWLPRLAAEYETVFCDLFGRRPTVIHGEYYPENILLRDRAILPVDWERAAISAGEVDLAALTEGDWDPGDVRLAIESYVEARWEGDPPEDFAESLGAARVYLHLLALGDRGKAFEPGAAWRFRQLELAGAERGLL